MKVRGDFLGPPRSTDKTTLIIKVSNGAILRIRHDCSVTTRLYTHTHTCQTCSLASNIQISSAREPHSLSLSLYPFVACYYKLQTVCVQIRPNILSDLILIHTVWLTEFKKLKNVFKLVSVFYMLHLIGLHAPTCTPDRLVGPPKTFTKVMGKNRFTI